MFPVDPQFLLSASYGTMEGADIAAAMGGTPNDKISSSQESKTILFDSVETIGYGASTPEEAAADTINLLSGLEQ